MDITLLAPSHPQVQFKFFALMSLHFNTFPKLSFEFFSPESTLLLFIRCISSLDKPRE